MVDRYVSSLIVQKLTDFSKRSAKVRLFLTNKNISLKNYCCFAFSLTLPYIITFGRQQCAIER